MSLLLLFLLLLLQTNSAITQLWHRSVTREEGVREARALIQLISQESKSLYHPEELAWNVPLQTLPLLNNLFFLTILPQEKRPQNNQGDLCAVGYFMAPESSTSSSALFKNSGYCLYRFMASAEETLQALQQGTLMPLYQTASPNDDNHCERIASNILDFKVTPIWYNNSRFITSNTDQQKKTPSLMKLQIITAFATAHHGEESFSTTIYLPSNVVKKGN